MDIDSAANPAVCTSVIDGRHNSHSDTAFQAAKAATDQSIIPFIQLTDQQTNLSFHFKSIDRCYLNIGHTHEQILLIGSIYQYLYSPDWKISNNLRNWCSWDLFLHISTGYRSYRSQKAI